MTDNPFVLEAGGSMVARLVCEPELGARRRRVAADTVLHDMDSPALEVFLIHSGEVRLYQLALDGSRRLMEILGPGEWFGAEAVGRLSQYGCQARAMTDTTVYVLPVQRFLEALPTRPEASLEIIHQLAERLSTAAEEAGDLAFEDCRRRLVKTLIKFSRSTAAKPNGDGVILRMTHEQLAQAVGAARETVSLMLTQLRNARVLTTGRNQLAFNPKALTAFLNFG
jgi:CRP/FNR family transcriptional regulator